jgi:Domain of unknown function (DUF4188)
MASGRREIFHGRCTAKVDSDVVVFLIGMRINRLSAVSMWWPVATAMPEMQKELARHPELGCIHTENWFGRTTISLQYWRDFESLHAYARNPNQPHLPAWRDFNQAVRDNGTVGIWHETYRVSRGNSEAIYGNMPRFGLASAFEHVTASSIGNSAAKRIGADTADRNAVDPY